MDFPIRGCDHALAKLGEFASASDHGSGTAFAVTGAPGSGKTMLCRWTTAQLAAAHVVSLQGRSDEATLPYAALGDLVRGLRAEPSRLESSQSGILRAAMDGAELPTAAPLAVLEAARTVVAETTRPTMVVVDDWDRLDPASMRTLAYVSHRVDGTAVSVLVAGSHVDGLEGVDGVRLDPLDEESTAAAIMDRTDLQVSPDVAAKVQRLAAGNPRHIDELARSLPRDLLAGKIPWPKRLRVPEPVRRRLRPQIAALPPRTRDALLVVAASGGRRHAIEPALARLGAATIDDLLPAERSGIVRRTRQSVRVLEPLVTLTIYADASDADRAAAHAALASHADDPARRVTHLAAAATGPDGRVADELAAIGRKALLDGHPEEAGRELERAAALAPDRVRRAGHRRDAARAWYLHGYPTHARRLLNASGEEPATTAAVLEADVWSAPPGQVREEAERARARRPDDPDTDARLLRVAAAAALLSGDAAAAVDSARRARTVAPDRHGIAAASALEGHALLLCGSFEDGSASLEHALRTLGGESGADPVATFSIASGMLLSGDVAGAAHWSDLRAAQARRHGIFALLPVALTVLGDALTRIGRFAAAATALSEAVEVGIGLGQTTLVAHALAVHARLDASRGDSASCKARSTEASSIADRYGLGLADAAAEHAMGLAAVADERWAEAVVFLQRAQAATQRCGIVDPNAIPWAPDLVEAYARSGDRAAACELADRLADVAGRAPTPWLVAAALRAQGVAAGADGSVALEAAVDAFRAGGFGFEEARTRLLLAENLYTAGCRIGKAVSHAREALVTFERLGAAPWAARARAGVGWAPPSLATTPTIELSVLTARERRIVGLITTGATNREIAGELFLSIKTVENYLSRIYAKLGVRSRTQLAFLVALSGELDTSDPTTEALP